MMTAPHNSTNPRQNALIAAIPDADWQRWKPNFELVDLKLGQVLYGLVKSPNYVIFPTTAIVSLIYLAHDGGASEYSVVGKDGVVGIDLFMGEEGKQNQAVVQSAGWGYRLSRESMTDELRRGGAMQQILMRYTQAMIAQLAQTAMCQRHHSIEQLVCRRLLMSLDRLECNELLITQELLASLLGVRRESVTATALKLQQDGVIKYARGHIAVLDRKRLEQRTCEYVQTTRNAHSHLQAMPLAA